MFNSNLANTTNRTRTLAHTHTRTLIQKCLSFALVVYMYVFVSYFFIFDAFLMKFSLYKLVHILRLVLVASTLGIFSFYVRMVRRKRKT